MSIQRLEVPPEKLTRVCDPDGLGFETTEQIDPLEGTIGQERAISALELRWTSMLLESVRGSKFRIYAVSNIDEGI